jgi:hypothetical protein
MKGEGGRHPVGTTNALDIHVPRPNIVHADIILFSTTQCSSLFVISMLRNFFFQSCRDKGGGGEGDKELGPYLLF